MARDRITARRAHRYGDCLSHGSDCEDQKQDCLALCKVRFGDGE
jgi:hypothetical protein